MKEDPASAERDGAARLLEAARACLVEGHGETVSVRELISVALVTRPVLYYHFGSRSGLLQAADWSLNAQGETALWRAAALEDSLEERIRRVCRVLATHRRVQARAIAIVESLVSDGVVSGAFEIVDIRGAALSLVGAATTASAHTPSPAAHDIDSALAVVFQGLLRNPEGVFLSDGAADRRALAVRLRRLESEGQTGMVKKT